MTGVVNGTPGIRIAPHETFELHELLTFKNVCATKASAMVAFVKDEELKTLMRKDFDISRGHIRELSGLLQIADFSGTNEDSGVQGLQ